MANEYVAESGAKFYKGDVVLFSRVNAIVGANAAGEVWYHFQVDGECRTCVSLWTFDSVSTDGLYAKYRIQEAPRLFESSLLYCVCIHRRNIANAATLIVPEQYRLRMAGR